MRLSLAALKTTIKPLALESQDTTENRTCGNAVSTSFACVVEKSAVSARIRVSASRANKTPPVRCKFRRLWRNRRRRSVSIHGFCLLGLWRIKRYVSMYADSDNTQADMSSLMLHLNNIKRIDMKVAVDVAALANMPVRDSNGNLLPLVWTRQSVSNEFENATLLTRDALQKHLQTFIDAGVKENIDILQKVEDPAILVDWVVRTAEYWEKRYAAKRDEKYDISQTVYSAMFEALGLQRIRDALDAIKFADVQHKLNAKIFELRSGKNKYHKLLLQFVSEHHSDLESFFWLHRGFAAVVRLMFRCDAIPNMREHLCVLAGKMLQKKEVCNKPGSYSSQRQRSDVVSELGHQVRAFLNFLDSLTEKEMKKLSEEFEKDEWIFLVIDHTALPVTLTHMRTPPICVPDLSQTLRPNIESKRRRVHEHEEEDEM